MKTAKNIYDACHSALMACEPADKVAQVRELMAAWQAGELNMEAGEAVQRIAEPGRPKNLQLVRPRDLPQRKPASREGRAVLFHALTHIEFNAINLALDAVYRFRSMPRDYVDNWLQVADEEALHFELLSKHLQDLDCHYGDYPGHNGLWEMAMKTDHDVLARMALVPRCLEARGLDVNPGIQAKLLKVGDEEGVGLLEIIMRDEIGHVAIGNRWFLYCCQQAKLEPMSTYQQLLDQYMDHPQRPPFAIEARREAGFSEEELAYLEGIG